MREIVRYECEWCKKLFKTPNRHKCRFDPKYRNCLSCKHCGKFGTAEEEDWSVIRGFRCLKDNTDVGDGWYNDFPMAVRCGSGCPDWEIMPGYCGSRSFALRADRLSSPVESTSGNGFNPKDYYEKLLDDPMVRAIFEERHGYSLSGKSEKDDAK